MFRLGRKLLLSRIKWFVLITLTIAVITSSIISIFTASNEIRLGLLNKAYTQYGEHNGVLLGIETPKSELRKKVEKIGEFQLLDTFKLHNNDREATIGWLDGEAKSLSHIKVIEGTFPKKANEVAVESAYLNLIDPNWKVGETTILKGNNSHWEVKLVGILSNYSSKWYIPLDKEDRISSFPSILVGSSENSSNKEKSYLVKIGSDWLISTNEMDNLLNDYEYEGFVNFKLFYDGLNEYNMILYLCFFFQCFLLIISTFCLISIFSYFNRKQMQKIAIMKAVGIKNKSLYLIYIYQCFLLFFMGIVFAIPLQYLFKKFILKMSFEESIIISQSGTFFIILAYLGFIFLLILFSSIRPLLKSKSYSLKQLMTDDVSNVRTHYFSKRFKHFETKQLVRQLFLFPKQFAYTVISISMSILILIFSIVLQKESEGIWNVDEHYYLNSQEIYGFDTVDNIPLLLKQGLTFSKKDALEIENSPGVKHVEKNPFMVDVIPLIENGQETTSIDWWLKKNGETLFFENKVIIPNVKYDIVNFKEFKKVYPQGNFEEFKGKVLIYNPNQEGKNEFGTNRLKDQKVLFVKLIKNGNHISKIEEGYEVYDVLNKPLTKHVDGMQDIEYNDLTIVFNEETIINSPFFYGFNEFIIYLNSDITSKEYQRIDDKVNQLIAITPGSFLQNIPNSIQEEKRITSLLSILGKFSFIIASILTCLSITIIIFSKYQLQKREWGIYLSIGMSKKKLIFFLTIEMLIYLILAIIISLIVFTIYLIASDLIYPVSYYFLYFTFSILLLFILLMINGYFLYRIINEQSVFSLLREEE